MAKCPSVKTRIKNALEGARAGGLEVGRVIVRPDGEVVIVAGKPGMQIAATRRPTRQQRT